MLPTGVRRRWQLRDGLLPAVLTGELLAGMALGAVWPQLTATGPVVPQSALTAVTNREPVPAVVLPPSPSAVPLPMHAPRNPFATQLR